MNQNSIRIVLVGKTGVGKSSTGNTILGEKMFKSEARATLSKKQCTSGRQIIKDREVLVVDTPGLYDASLFNEELVQEIMKCITLAAPGPHVFLLILSIGRFTAEDRSIIKWIQELFGNGVLSHMIVLFTRADDLEGRKIEEYIHENSELNEVIKACKGRYHAFNNRDKSDHTQVDQLIGKIEVVIEQNENNYYNYDVFDLIYELNKTKRTVKEKEEIIVGLQKKIKEMEKGVYCCIS